MKVGGYCMNVHIHGRNLTITQAMQAHTEKKLEFLHKYFLISEETPAQVSCMVHPSQLKVEITIHTKFAILRAEVIHEDYYSAIDLAIDKLEDQIRRQKTRLSRKHREKLAQAFADQIDAQEQVGVVKTKQVEAEYMSLDDAILRMEMLGHSFFVYTDEDDKQLSIVYKRHDGGYGLLETIPAQ